MKCIVTGGAGFIGSNLAIRLEQEGNRVTVIDNFQTGTKENLKDFKGAILDIDISRNFQYDQDVDVIFHIAAITDPRFEDDQEMMRSNLDGFNHMIELAQSTGAKFVYASSASVYGNGSTPMKEDQEKDLLCTYAKSKIQMDEIAQKLAQKMHIVGLRYFNVFGPRESHKGRPASMIYHLRNQIKDGKNPRLFNFGDQKRDHIYVIDVVEATMAAADAESGVYNVGTGIATSFNKIVTILNDELNMNNEIEYFENPYKGSYQDNTQADITRASKKLKWKSRFSPREGIKGYLKWLDENE